jgi:hypothetical protein
MSHRFDIADFLPRTGHADRGVLARLCISGFISLR